KPQNQSAIQPVRYLCGMLESILVESVQEGAKQMRRFFEGNFKISNKEGINNLVTEADIASEQAIIACIRSQFPDHAILTEEQGALDAKSDYKWIIDPIDGTVNFANGIPICCVSVA